MNVLFSVLYLFFALHVYVPSSDSEAVKEYVAFVVLVATLFPFGSNIVTSGAGSPSALH